MSVGTPSGSQELVLNACRSVCVWRGGRGHITTNVRAATCAPFSNKNLSKSVKPCHAAKCSAVELLLARDSKSTPASTNNLATLSCFCQHAACNGVNCSRFLILGLQPRARSSVAMATAPRLAAMWSSVSPSLRVSSSAAPWSNKYLAFISMSHRNCSRQHAFHSRVVRPRKKGAAGGHHLSHNHCSPRVNTKNNEITVDGARASRYLPHPPNCIAPRGGWVLIHLGWCQSWRHLSLPTIQQDPCCRLSQRQPLVTFR